MFRASMLADADSNSSGTASPQRPRVHDEFNSNEHAVARAAVVSPPSTATPPKQAAHDAQSVQQAGSIARAAQAGSGADAAAQDDWEAEYTPMSELQDDA